MNNMNKPFPEQVLVVTANTATQTAGTALVNQTNAPITVGGTTYQPGEFMLETGRFGIYDSKTNLAVDLTATNPKSVYIAVKRNTANDSDILPPRPIEKTNDIDPRNGITFIGESVINANRDLHVIGERNAVGTGNINVANETDYQIRIGIDGRRVEIINGPTRYALVVDYKTPNYTALGMTTINSRNHLIQNLGAQLLNQSAVNYSADKTHVVFPFALSSVAVSGNTTTVGSLVLNQSVLVGYTNGDTTKPVRVTVTQEMLDSFTAAIAADATIGTSVVVPINTTTASTGTVDRLMIVANNDKRGFRDNIRENKISLMPSLTLGFDSGVKMINPAKGKQGTGYGSMWQLEYEKNAALSKFDSTLERFDGKWIGYPSDITEATRYLAFTVEFNSNSEVSNGTLSYHPQRVIILVTNGNTTAKNSLQAQLNAYVTANGGDFASNVALSGSGQVAI